MEYLTAKETQHRLNMEVNAASTDLRAIPGLGSGAMGLTPDHVKASPEFRAAKARYDAAFAALRRFNMRFTKEFKREITAEHTARR